MISKQILDDLMHVLEKADDRIDEDAYENLSHLWRRLSEAKSGVGSMAINPIFDLIYSALGDLKLLIDTREDREKWEMLRALVIDARTGWQRRKAFAKTPDFPIGVAPMVRASEALQTATEAALSAPADKKFINNETLWGKK